MVRLRERPSTSGRWRLALLKVVCVTTFGLLLGGATLRGFLQGEELVSEANSRYIDELALNAERGIIWDRNGRMLATSIVVYSAHMNPRLYRRWIEEDGPEGLAEREGRLAELMGITVEDFEDAKRRDSGFAYLRHGMLPEERGAVADLGLPHISFEKRYRRFYPSGQEAAQVVGFTDHKGIGQEGLERFAQGRLSPAAGSRRVLRTKEGRVLEIFSEEPAVGGDDLRTTIDSRLQYFAALAMRRMVEHHDAVSASFVMINVRTGEIVSMVTVPTYNPNKSIIDDADVRRARVLQDIFEPGSTVKPLLAAIAIEQGVVAPDTVLATAKPISYPGKIIDDERIHTDISLSETIMRSSNKGAVRVSELLDDELMWRGFRDFGFGSPLLGWPAENSGVLHDWEKWRPVEKATMSYGYYVSANLLQMARAYGALGNGGVLPRLSIVKSGEAAGDEVRVVSPETARQVIGMMENVVSSGGTARRAAINGYRVAGKTGTSHKRLAEAGGEGKGYTDDVYQSLFVGLAPASDPVFAAAVFVDQPRRNGYYGGLVAAPIFSEVVGHALRMYAVPPDLLGDDGEDGEGQAVALLRD